MLSQLSKDQMKPFYASVISQILHENLHYTITLRIQPVVYVFCEKMNLGMIPYDLFASKISA